MAINFPDSPTEGQKFTQGAVAFTFTGGVWQAAPLGTAQSFNRIVNPSMQVQQDAAMLGTYVADEWSGASNVLPATAEREQSTSPYGSQYMLHIYQATAKPTLVGTDWGGWGQHIEGSRIADFQWGTALAKQVILRFGFWTDTAGTYSIVILNAALNRSYVDTFVVTTGQRNTYVYYTFVIPGDTTGTWATDQSKGLVLNITMFAGPTYVTPTKGWQAGEFYAHSSQTNNITVAGADFYLMDVGLYLDPKLTGKAPPWQSRPFLEDMQDCLRYFQRQAYSQGMGYNVATNTPIRAGSINQVPMRAPPAMAIVGSMGSSDTTGYALTALTAPGASTELIGEADMQSTGAHVLGRAVIVYQNNGASWISLNARMA